MKKHVPAPTEVRSIAEMHRLLQLPKPEHPLVSVIDLSAINCTIDERFARMVYNFWTIYIKKDFDGRVKYGQNDYDFDSGIMTFFAPGQVITTEVTGATSAKGWCLAVHPDLLRNYPLAKTIKEQGYFSYAVHEALHISEKEEQLVTSIVYGIEQEYRSGIDAFSQDVIISRIELLLTYANRFYNRQFITRKHVNSDLLSSLESLLDDHFAKADVHVTGLPTVHQLAEQLHLSPNYLSDMLRNLTGQNAQQHIHNKIIEQAKQKLTNSSLSVSEIAYQLGFEHPQSFNKLFKSKVSVSPLEFRRSFN